MNLLEARNITTDGVLHIGNSTFSPAKIDRAIQFALNYFVNETRCVTAKGTLAIQKDAYEVDFSELDGFQPSFVQHMRIGFRQLQIADYEYVRGELEMGGVAGRPTHIGFETFTNAIISPEADDDYTLTVSWNPPATTWVPGLDVSEANELELNVPDRLIRPALWYGAAAALVYGQMDGNPWPSTGWQLFQQYTEQVKPYAVVDIERAMAVPFPSKVKVESAAAQQGAVH